MSREAELEAIQQTITSERAMLLVAALVDAVRRHVEDRRVVLADKYIRSKTGQDRPIGCHSGDYPSLALTENSLAAEPRCGYQPF